MTTVTTDRTPEDLTQIETRAFEHINLFVEHDLKNPTSPYGIFCRSIWTDIKRVTLKDALQQYTAIAQDLRRQCLEQLAARGRLKQGELS
jgi:hypothetical protein